MIKDSALPADRAQRTSVGLNAITVVQEVVPPFIPEGAAGMTVIVEYPPGDPGAPPHRHSGPAFGYVLEGEVLFELEGEAQRVLQAGEAFWEPGGDVIHYQDGNNRDDIRSRFLVTMLCVPGKPMFTLVGAEELAQRANRRASSQAS
ncbi:cupin domain-containing protein [Mycobacterium antarcticum]|uniref:cupin domain-containing protein n=1 Tax=Mycolicibacterium sp. TUM20984 TaxID=3023368 RepID=UPI0023870298|nr:cupin domain-containing protein [Mycolicibacterium sp. TUM20984]GLP81533.1 cupin [Mycolicibacterium sp. TUM20984]